MNISKSIGKTMGLIDPDLTTPGHDAIMLAIARDHGHFINLLKRANISTEVDIDEVTFEAPVIVGSNGFVIGHLDVLYRCSNDKGGRWKIGVEIKTSIKSCGELLRQINTYREALIGARDSYGTPRSQGSVIMVVVAPSDQLGRWREFLTAQDVRCVNAEELGYSS